MTVPVQTPINSYVYAGGSSFVYSFQLLQSTDLLVTVDGVTKTLGTDYTVSGVGVQAGGTITYLTTITVGQLVSLSRQTTLSRATDYQTLGDFLAGTINNDFDRLWMALQERVTNDARSIRAPAGETLATLPAAATRGGYLLGFDGAGGLALIAAAAQSATALALSLLSSAGSAFVSFLQAGAGATLRTLQSKNRDIVHMRDYGAFCDGVTNDSAALQAAHDAIALAGGGKLYVSQAKLNSTFNWDPNKVAIQGDGGNWDFSSLGAAAYAINVIQSETDVNLRTQKNRAHPLQNLRINGPTGATTINGLLINDAVSNTVSGVTVRDCAFSGFINDVTLQNGAFFTLFVNCDFTNDAAGHKSQRNVSIPSAANSGENNTFMNCRFGVVVTENINQANGNASTYLIGCSFDYGARMVTINAGGLFLTSSHIEFSSDADWMFYITSGGNPTVVIAQSTFAIAAAKSVKGFAYVDSLVNTTGLTIRDCKVGAINPITVPWADGTGRVLVQNVDRYTSTGYMFSPAAGQSGLAYGDFESASFSNEFNCQGTTVPARSTTVAKSGTNSLRFQGVVGQVNFADCSVSCSVGQTANFSLWYYGAGITGTSTIFVANLRYLDANNGVLSSNPVFSISADTSSTWVLATPVASFSAAPPGTRTAQLRMIIQNTVSGTPLGYVDLVNLSVQ